jgi:hypothetical protein
VVTRPPLGKCSINISPRHTISSAGTSVHLLESDDAHTHAIHSHSPFATRHPSGPDDSSTKGILQFQRSTVHKGDGGGIGGH